MSTIAIIQARLGSERLPNKVLLQIPPESGVSMLEMVIRKVLLATLVDEVVVATPDSKLVELCGRWNTEAFLPGFEERDVLREYYDIATALAADVIVRITADCPLVKPEVIDKCIEAYGKNICDIAYNTCETMGQLEGEGSDVEVFSYDALKQAYYHAKCKEREHPTLWMRRNLKTLFFPCAPFGIRSVNTKEDYEFVCDYVDGVR